MTNNRIFFNKNPYPLGHKIIEFVWSGHLDESGQLWFDFHLETDKYYAEDPTHFDEPTEDESSEEAISTEDWDAKAAWGNFHACTMSSTKWGSDGILIDSKALKLNFAIWPQLSLIADTMPPDLIMPADMEWDDLAINIYLLGHDACANHQIEITQNGALFDIHWTGKIALAYVGEDEFKYDFSANISDVKFAGFEYPQSFSQEVARTHFAQYIANMENFEFIDLNPNSNKHEYKFVLK